MSDDEDLHDAFSILYAGDEWHDWAGDDIVDAATDASSKNLMPARYSRAHLRAALASLVAPSFGPSSAPSRKRIYPEPAAAPGVIPSTSPLPPIDGNTYAPFSALPLLARLRTFTPATFSPRMPPELSPRALALAGWVNNAKDGLACASARAGQKGAKGSLGCKAEWGVGGLEDLPARMRDEVVRRLAASISKRHEVGCGWRVLASPPDLVSQLRRTVHPLVSGSLSALACALQARTIGPVLPRWTSPLSSSQTDHLVAALVRAAEGPMQLDPLAATLALFGWYPHDPLTPSDHVAPTTLPGTASRTDIVACRLCARRIGLWMFAPPHSDKADRVLAVHAEHLAWCPLSNADGWWTECPLLQPPSGVPRLGDEQPGSRWKRRKTTVANKSSAAAKDPTTPAPVASGRVLAA